MKHLQLEICKRLIFERFITDEIIDIDWFQVMDSV
jgi:hypothetical protein